MNIEATKLELMQMLLNTQKETILLKLKEVFEKEGEEILSEDQKSVLSERLEKYEAGEMKFKSWEDSKERIRNRAKNDL